MGSRGASVGDSAISDEPTDRRDPGESAQQPAAPQGPLPFAAQPSQSAAQPSQQVSGQPTAPPPLSVPSDLGRQVALYTLARIGLVAVVTVILTVAHVPLLVSLVIAIVVALPLAMLLLRGWSARISEGLAARRAIRRSARNALRAELRGEFDGTDPDTGSQS